MDLIEQFQRKAKVKKKQNRNYYKRLGRKNTKGLDDVFHSLHDSVFEEIDCLECANCCKTTSPMFTKTDVSRIAKHQKMSVSEFTKKYLRVDEDGDTVLKSSPCPFLGKDNYCGIYEARPKACREYPHTNRKQMHQILHTTYLNTLVCPAVFELTEQLKKILPEREM
ncbi:MAG: YkgJ family cysteine cluster protein [Saprospiraceae bacterium]